MATDTVDRESAMHDRPSGVPPPHHLGEARCEVGNLLAAVVILGLIVSSFWFEATH
jgi:hypothetical protein